MFEFHTVSPLFISFIGCSDTVPKILLWKSLRHPDVDSCPPPLKLGGLAVSMSKILQIMSHQPSHTVSAPSETVAPTRVDTAPQQGQSYTFPSVLHTISHLDVQDQRCLVMDPRSRFVDLSTPTTRTLMWLRYRAINFLGRIRSLVSDLTSLFIGACPC